MRVVLAIAAAALTTTCLAATAPTRVQLPNGARIVTSPEPGSEWVMISAFIAGGADTCADKPGARSVTAQAAYQRRKTVGKAELDAVSAHIGGGIKLTVERNYLRYDVLTTRPWSANALFLIVGALKDAELSQEDVDAAKSAVKSTLPAFDSPAGFGLRSLVKRAFGTHPYAHQLTAEDVDAVTVADCQRYYRAYFTPKRVTVVFAGAIEGTLVVESASTSLGTWDTSPAAISAPAPVQLTDSFDIVRSRDTASAYVMAGCVGPQPASPDFPAFAVLGAILGKGQSSRLAAALRATGQAYQVGTSLLPTEAGTLLYGWTQFNPLELDSATGSGYSVAGSTRDTVRHTFTKLVSEGPSTDELERAKRVLEVDYMLADPPNRLSAGPFVQGHQRLRDRVFWLGWWEMVGCGYTMDAKFPDLVEKVTTDEVKRVAKKYAAALGTVMVVPAKP